MDKRIDSSKSIWLGSIHKIPDKNIELFLKQCLISQYFDIDLEEAQKYDEIVNSIIINKEKRFSLIEFIDEKYKTFFIEKKELILKDDQGKPYFLPVKHYRQKQSQYSFKKRSRYESNCNSRYDDDTKSNEDMYEEEEYGTVSRKKDRYYDSSSMYSQHPQFMPSTFFQYHPGQASFFYPSPIPFYHQGGLPNSSVSTTAMSSMPSRSFYGSGIAYRKQNK